MSIRKKMNFAEALNELKQRCYHRMTAMKIDRIRYRSNSFQYLENYTPKRLTKAEEKYFANLFHIVGSPILKDNLVNYDEARIIMVLSLTGFDSYDSVRFEVGYDDGVDWNLRDVNLNNGALEPDWDELIEMFESTDFTALREHRIKKYIREERKDEIDRYQTLNDEDNINLVNSEIIDLMQSIGERE